MNTCFAHVDSCQQHHTSTCTYQSSQCFSNNYHDFDFCFKQLASCINDEDHEDLDEECSCSCQINKCFEAKDGEACSEMFDTCFVKEDSHDDDHECLDDVRQCIHDNEDHNQCISLMATCFHHQAQYSCSDEVSE